MTTSMGDKLKADARRHVNRWGEDIVYRRASDPDNPLEIKAIVDRPALEAQREDKRRTVSAPMQIHVHRDDLPALDTNGDTVKIAPSVGSAPVWMPVTARLDDDEGLWYLAVGR